MQADGHHPRKRFGQHFLRDQRVLQRMLSAIAPGPGEHLVEIGPGRGALTDLLMDRAELLTAIEIDRVLVEQLCQRHGSRGNFRLLEGDALRFNYGSLAQNGPLRLVGNLPYNLSTPLLFALLEQRAVIADMVFMLQKEVVDRLAAVPGTKAYGRLGVMVQYHCQVQPLFEVPPASFFPPPRVDSAVVRLVPYANPTPVAEAPEHLAQLVNQCFQQRRKTLRNCLRSQLDPTSGDILPASLDARPETLSVADFVALSNHLVARSRGGPPTGETVP